MKQEALLQFQNLWMTVGALAIFMTLFIAFAVYVFFVERKSTLKYKENIPFQVADEISGEPQ
jgi:cbb3-type cytochrome oxidase subunit 3